MTSPGTTCAASFLIGFSLLSAACQARWHWPGSDARGIVHAPPRECALILGQGCPLICAERGWGEPSGSRTEEGQYRQHAAVVVGSFIQAQFAEDAADVSLDRLGAQHQNLGDALVRPALGDEREYLAFASAQFIEGSRPAGPPDQPGDDGWVEYAFALGDTHNRVLEHADVRYALFEQVTPRLRVVLEQARGVARLQVLGQDQYADLGMGGADPLGCDQAFVGMGGRHLDVDDRHVGMLGGHDPKELLGVIGLAGNLHAGLFEEAGCPLPHQHGVVGNHNTHGISPVIVRPDAPGASSMRSLPPSAPTRSASSGSRAWSS